VDDAFFLGDALLVCPILEEGARSRSVILPKGHWYNFWDDTANEGGRQITLEAPLEQIPLLVRAGSILPMEESEQLILHLYPPAEGTSVGYLYGDAGDGYGEWRLEQFQIVRSPGGLELTWEQQGDYAFPYKSVRLHFHGFKVQQAWVDEEEVICQGQQLECQPFGQVRFKGEFAIVMP
jgi:alpha-glucosidase